MDSSHFMNRTVSFFTSSSSTPSGMPLPVHFILPTVASSSMVVQNVNCYNLEEEMQKISKLASKYPYIAIDTEFPGTLDIPMGTFETCADYEYALFKSNVDRMNIIQLGLSFFDEDGCQPGPIHTWQFNFRFNLEDELYAEDSIQMLEASGIDFAEHQTAGIEPNHFAERLVTSGIVCNETIRFLTFHSAYDFGYLYKLLEGKPTLPPTEAGFLDVIRMYFPKVFDIKYMLKDFPSPKLKGGLQDLADSFRLVRTGNQHQAGSDSALTGSLFFRLKRDVLPVRLDPFLGHIYGLSGVLALDRVRRLDNVIIRKNADGSLLLPTAFYGIKEPMMQAATSEPARQYIPHPSGLFSGMGVSHVATAEEYTSPYAKLAALVKQQQPPLPSFPHSHSMPALPHHFTSASSSGGYPTYGHDGTVYYA
ncbi:CCR4-NOT transcription complex subunit 7 [Hypsibius exemplaris]|uniref:poly(A)-specific ribonuclease n=1 Tax=Hypsibius exemplaris TaxID=2072580 RepID=A0A9X6NLG2_HYPEX|nr:CCR4-NOT transcription complex subunit 7 [Hypsibius exemplaris]